MSRPLLAATLGAFLLALPAAAGEPPPFDLQGHRGARGLAPENTRAAFEAALAVGVTTLELDVVVSRDGAVVVSHDPLLNPDLTPGPAAFVDAVLAVAREAGVLPRLIVQSFDWRSLRHVKTTAAAVETACLTVQQPDEDNVQRGREGASPALAGLDADDFPSVPALVAAAGCAVWSPHARDLTPALLADARARGLRMIPWTVNQAAEIAALVDAGVDGLISDDPDRVRDVLAARGRPLPPRVCLPRRGNVRRPGAGPTRGRARRWLQSPSWHPRG